MKTALVSVLVALATGQPATSLQRKALPLYEFSALKTFRCDFTESEGRRTSAQGVTTSASRESFSDLVIDNVDYQRRAARFIGNAGSETVQVIDGKMTVSFLEVTETGNVAVLSIFKSTGSMGTYRAAYARHMSFTPGNLAISQSYGTCRGLL
jgi:hypothetical protein